jgi:signal transduction histidine kinase
MRRRLINTYLLLLTLVLLALELPLMASVAARRTEAMVIDRLLDASGYASLADSSLRTNQLVSLREGLNRYYELYGISGAVFDRDGKVKITSGDPAAFDAPEVRQRMGQALAGDRAGAVNTIWPWQSAPLIVAVPVTSGAEVIGAVVTLSPTDRMRAEVARLWIGFGLSGVAALFVFVAVAFALTRWILRPIAELDGTAHRLAEGTLDARVAADLGPPEVRRLARSFNEMADNVEDALERQRAFVSQASHQLRNPLTSLRIRVENLAEYVQLAGREEHRLTLAEVDRFGTILDSLLALARAERGQHVRGEVDAAAIADDRVAAWQPLAEQRGIALERTGPASAPAHAVLTAVDQALDALIDNALKFAGPGGHVTVRVRPGPETVELDVIDDGPGLPDDHLRRATERFWRAADAQNLDGSGLGLPIAAVLVEASAGTLTLHRAGARGLDARLSFPAAPSHLHGTEVPHGAGVQADRAGRDAGARVDSVGPWELPADPGPLGEQRGGDELHEVV